jgi:hypothetical protein
LAIYKLRKWPILSFAVLFFFLNHAIESSIIPLELIFEHRNYLPGMFLFWPVAVGLERLIGVYRSKNAIVYYGLVGFVPTLTGVRKSICGRMPWPKRRAPAGRTTTWQ